MITLFLGAGFSKWAAGLPLASELFDFDIVPWGPRESRRLNDTKELKRLWDSSHPNELAEQFIADVLHSNKRAASLVQWYIVRRLSEPFIWKEWRAGIWRRHSLMIDENRRFSLPAVEKTQEFLVEYCSPVLAGIVTTNYDMLVEYALGTRIFNYGFPNEELRGRGAYPISGPVVLSGNIPLSKLHGSVSWDVRWKYTEGRRGITGNALIVPPTHDKELPESLMHAQRLGENILRKSTRMIVFGFAFNPYDQDILTLLQTCGAHMEAVLLVNTPSSADSQIKAARNLWPRSEISFTAPPPDWTANVDAWGPHPRRSALRVMFQSQGRGKGPAARN